MVQVYTTMQPDVPLEVTEAEADQLRFQGLLAREASTPSPVPPLVPRNDQKREGQE